MSKHYHLTNIEDRHRNNPATFDMPSLTDRQSLQPGDWAKVIVDDMERLWVLVTGKTGLRYRATVLQVPVTVQLEKDDEIDFGPEHVADITKSFPKPILN